MDEGVVVGRSSLQDSFSVPFVSVPFVSVPFVSVPFVSVPFVSDRFDSVLNRIVRLGIVLPQLVQMVNWFPMIADLGGEDDSGRRNSSGEPGHGSSREPIPDPLPGAVGSPIPERPPQAVGFLLSQLGFETSVRFGKLMAEVDLEPRQFALMRAIEAFDGRSQNSVGEWLRIPPSSMVSVIDHLEARGLVERRLHPTDRRSRTLHLTAEGRAVLKRATELAMGLEQTICRGVRSGSPFGPARDARHGCRQPRARPGPASRHVVESRFTPLDRSLAGLITVCRGSHRLCPCPLSPLSSVVSGGSHRAGTVARARLGERSELRRTS